MLRSDIPFAADDAHAFLPWIIGVMAALATLLLCLGVTAGSWIVERHAGYADSFTVNIPAGDDELQQKLAKVHDILQKLPMVTSISQVSESHLREMLKPWLGSGDAVSALPLPIVLDVAIKTGTHPDYKEIGNRLNAVAPGTEVDAHEQWVIEFSQFSTAMRSLLTALAVLIIGALGLMVAFTARAALKMHARTVQLLHSTGAEDGYIARQFQHEAFMLAVRGAAPGCLSAGLIYWVVGRYMASLPSSLLPSLGMHGTHILLLLIMPLACGTVAWTAARLSIIRQLQRAL